MSDHTELHDAHEALLQFLYLAPVGLVQMTLDGRVTMLNPLSAQLLMPLARQGDGLSNLFDTLEPIAPELRYMAVSFQPPRGTICEGYRLQVSAGVPGREDAQVLSITLVKLDPKRLMVVISDVSLAVKRERMLRQNEAWFNAVMVGVADYALITLDAKGDVSEWNPSIGRLTGLTAQDVCGHNVAVLYPGDCMTADRVLDRLREADANGWSLDEGWHLRADGSRFWGSSMITPLQQKTADDGSLISSGYALIVRDITEKRKSAESLLHSISCDHLTGIANRRAFFEAAELELRRHQRVPRPISLLLIDADHFKQINDDHGHAMGDTVLQKLALILTQSVRGIDVVARVGGEEFAVLLPSTWMDEAVDIAERIRKVVEMQSINVGGADLRYTVSIGVSVISSTITSLGELMDAADKALYLAKRSGRNQVRTLADLPRTAFGLEAFSESV
ncbi:PAS domain S-box-containing protein/diguanylate cyclase (GGDEF) domain-containing protein [Noviherbaspirillum humi]|uniref:PAS domain S-box-containing protein/diguanylate cyclase (GGDEF) domain-containing protein n=1 Tax=Noviherbaspirillum humi TaxID=1688639 RepID=A0A239L6M8_9BURK|nr:sensor domain-containing diguanylate cyclase [Noviherbaspirillum humi]SNT25513.1 PAS domain S-box-containing protein/diguanylate cyclase (GGDEF) domain-containing protein [Noviherbaspirillum humi]